MLFRGFRFRPALARRLQFISTKRKEKEVGANIDNLHKAGLGQGFGIVDCGMLNQKAEKRAHSVMEEWETGAWKVY